MSGSNVAAVTADQECPACAKPEPLERRRWLGLASVERDDIRGSVHCGASSAML